VTPVERWSKEEREARAVLHEGITLAVNMRRHRDLIAWAKEETASTQVQQRASVGKPVASAKHQR
jgi:hypothetical protein